MGLVKQLEGYNKNDVESRATEGWDMPLYLNIHSAQCLADNLNTHSWGNLGGGGADENRS